MTVSLRNEFNSQTRVLLGGFLEPVQLDQFRSILEPARWCERVAERGWVETLDPARHGLVTGQVCEYLSQPQLLDALAGLMGHRPRHFLGNIVRVAHANQPRLLWDDSADLGVGNALAINIGSTELQIESPGQNSNLRFHTGDAVLMKIDQGIRHKLVTSTDFGILIEGFHLGP